MRYLLLTVLLGLVGCASGPPPDLSPDARATLGTIGVLAGDGPSAFTYATPSIGEAKGLVTGLGVWAELLRGCKDPYSAAGGLLLLPVFALGGAVYGAITDPASEEVATAEATLKATFAGVKVQDVIRDHIVATARDRTRHALVLLHHTDRPGPGEASRYAALAERGITTVLEVRVPQVALVAQRMHHDPPMSMVMSADVELIRVKDGAAIYTLSLERTRGTREFLAWGANSAEAFRDEVTAMSVTLANDIVEKVFAADLLPPPEPPPPAPMGAHDAGQTQDRGTDQSARQE